jgi:hypothetical protein
MKKQEKTKKKPVKVIYVQTKVSKITRINIRYLRIAFTYEMQRTAGQ